MLHKNVLALPKRKTAHSATSDESTEFAALRSLAGAFCSVCDTPLLTQDRVINGSPLPGSAYTCCKRAHCPFRGTTGREHCTHLAAYRLSGDWQIAGLPPLDG